MIPIGSKFKEAFREMVSEKTQIIEAFLAFAEKKGIELGGDVTYGFGLEHTEFRPMLKEDYSALIRDFVSDFCKRV